MKLRGFILAAWSLCLLSFPMRAGAQDSPSAPPSGGGETPADTGASGSGSSSGAGNTELGEDGRQHMDRRTFERRLDRETGSIAQASGGSAAAHDMAGRMSRMLRDVPVEQRESVISAMKTLHQGIQSGQVEMVGRGGTAAEFVSRNSSLFDSNVTSQEKATLQAIVTLDQANAGRMFREGGSLDGLGRTAQNTLAGGGASSGGAPSGPQSGSHGGPGGARPEGGAPSSQGSGFGGVSQSALKETDALTGGSNAYVKGMLAESLLRSGDRAGAMEAASQAAALRPDYVRPHVVLAQANFDGRDYAAARASAARALELDPKNQAAGAVYKMTAGRDGPSDMKSPGEVRSGAAFADRSGSMSPRETPSLPAVRSLKAPRPPADEDPSVRQFLERASRMSRGGDLSGAAELAAKALTRDPRSEAAALAQAQALIRQKRMDEAMKVLKAAIELSPDNPRLLVARSNILNLLKRSAEALQDAEQAIALDPKNARAHMNRGWALDALGRGPEAVESVGRAAALDPAYREYYERAKTLQDGELALLLSGEPLAARPSAKGRGAAGFLGLGRGAGMGLAVLAGLLMIGMGVLRTAAGGWREGVRRAFGTLARRTPGSRKPEAPGGILSASYRIVRQIGQGGMGVVYEAVDLALDRRVAIKRMRSDIRDDVVERERFLKEARMAASLHHPSIVGIYQVVEDGADAYLVFEHVDGKTLSELLRERGKLDFAEASGVVRRAAEGLDYAHSKGVVHRDLKPSNIMVDRERRVKVMDFGVASQVRDSAVPLTVARTIVGTPSYMAPEQEQGLSCPASDIYALGVCLYRMVSGEHPFGGAGLSLAKMKKDYAPASRLVPDLPSGFDAVLAKALEPEPAKRWATAGEFARALKSLESAVR